MIGVWHLILAFWSGGMMAIAAVALGGWLVFRTKRESHERLFSGRPEQGSVIMTDEFTPGGVIQPEGPVSNEQMDNITAAMNQRMTEGLNQAMDAVFGKERERANV